MPRFARFFSSVARVPVSPRWIGPVLGVVLLLIFCTIADVLYDGWQNAWSAAQTETNNISAGLTNDITRTIELYDLSIQGAVEAALHPGVLEAAPDLRQMVLFDRAATATFLGKILVLDPNGNVLADSASAAPNPTNYADRDYFRIHQLNPSFGLYISRPLRARSDNEVVIGLSRRITRPDGSFGGVVVGTLRLEYFHQLFRQMRLGPKGSLTLFRNDGILIMREPYDPALVGVKQNPPQLFDLAARSPSGEYEAESGVDGVRRLYHFRRVTNTPLVQNVGFAVNDIYARWTARASVVVAVVGVCCALITLLTLLLGRELRRRVEAETALRAMAEEDSLTGLANRRIFDRTLATEWRRASWHQTPLSLIMIDADHFKLLNDSLGHAAGDAALQQLAGCIAAQARRTSDLAARFGGEEFALVLPVTGSAGAVQVAESLQRAVEALGIAHPRSSFGRFTVSIGVATMVPDAQTSEIELIKKADAALYRSKSAGRNRVTHGGVDVPSPIRLAS